MTLKGRWAKFESDVFFPLWPKSTDLTAHRVFCNIGAKFLWWNSNK